MCCPVCFDDLWLKDYIDRKSKAVGVCEHCGQENVKTVAPADLQPEFEKVLEAYSPKAFGKRLFELLQGDWLLFSNAISDPGKLLSEILGTLADGFYEPRAIAGANAAAKNWTALREELKSSNRFFPVNAPNRDKFTELINNLVRSKIPDPLFRARTLKNETSFTSEQMGAPPSHLSGDGRANPVGIPYLYLAEDISTAINEVRPAKYDVVAIAKFHLANGRSPKLIDLSKPRSTISPFALQLESIGDVRNSMEFLCLLGEELSTPTLPHRVNIDYLASQYLCELIKNIGYDGVMYESSQTGGLNITFFDPLMAEPEIDVKNYKVTGLDLSFEPQEN